MLSRPSAFWGAVEAGEVADFPCEAEFGGGVRC